jgi:hypothetical protein
VGLSYAGVKKLLSLLSNNGKNGAQGRNRTTDTVIFSHVLYQLSYLGGWRRLDAAGAYKRPRRALSSVRRAIISRRLPLVRTSARPSCHQYAALETAMLRAVICDKR